VADLASAATADGSADAGPLSYDDAMVLVGSHRWVEHRLFEVTGTWSATADDPAVRLHLFEVSHQHAWHAELWEDRLPVRDGFDPDALTRPLGPALGPLFEAVGRQPEPGGNRAEGLETGDLSPDGDVARLVALYRVVLPRLIATYQRHLASTSKVADAPVIRALHLVLRDEMASWDEGEQRLQSLLATPEHVDLASRVQHRLERPIVEAGVRLGLVPWPAIDLG
jgi:hypothetical protein